MPAEYLIEHINSVAAAQLTRLDETNVVITTIAAVLAGLIVTPAALLLNLAIARRQWREGRGSWLRLFGVCCVIGLLQVTPLIVFALVFSNIGRSMQDQVLPVGILVVWNWLLLTLSIGRPVRLAHSRDELPLVDDEQFNARVNELASAMSLKTPIVRMVRSLSGEQTAAAFAGGLPAPSLVVTDGILHRLTPDERDAVVGHELAHLANGSLWWLTCVTPVAAVGGLAMAGVAGGWIGVLFGLALRVGLLRIVSRYFERDCDRRAADVIGYRTMGSALEKIHAAHMLRDAGWRSVLIYATATHPSRVERLASLEQSAPDDDKPNSQSAAAASSRIFAARTAAVVWCIVLAASFAGGCWSPAATWPSVLLIVVLTVPFWPLIDVWRQLMRIRKRTRKGGWRKFAAFTLTVIAVTAYFFADDFAVGLGAPTVTHAVRLASVASGLLVVLLLVGGASPRANRVRQQLLKALQNHEFEAAARTGADHQRLIQRVPELRHNVAVARILSGDWESGISELHDNVERHPRFAQSLLTLSTCYFDAGDFESACRAAKQASVLLKNDPEPMVSQAAALWRLGRLDEAGSLAQNAIQLEPDSGEPHAVLAGVLMARGDATGARDALETAERLSPGLPFARVVGAEVALRFGEPDDARRAVALARELARANPFAVIDRQVSRLEERLLEATEVR